MKYKSCKNDRLNTDFSRTYWDFLEIEIKEGCNMRTSHKFTHPITTLAQELTGLAQRRVVRITPIKGATVTIFEVKLGKNSFANTAKKQKLNHICPDALTLEINFEL